MTADNGRKILCEWEYKGKLIILPAEDIYYLCSEQRKTFVHTRNRVYQIGSTLKKAAEELKELPFIRTHYSYLVHLKHLECIDSREAVMRNGEKVPVSESCKSLAKKQVRNYMDWIKNKKLGENDRKQGLLSCPVETGNGI